MKAVVMAGGEGTRLRPLTVNRPKPLAPVCNKPVMEYIVELLKRHGVDQVVVTLQYLANEVISYFGDGSDWGVQMVYSVEDEPLGTAGSVKKVELYLNDTFIVISGDALTDFDLSSALSFHRDRGSMATIVLARTQDPLDYGVVITDEDGRIRKFLEKPSWGEVFSDTINSGIYILEPEVFEHLDENRACDFSKDLFPALLAKDAPLYGYVAKGYWCDIGNLQAYRQAHNDMFEGRVLAEIPGKRAGKNVWVGEGTEIHPEVHIRGPAIIGRNCRIKEGADVREMTVLGDNCIIEEGASVQRSILWNNVFVGPKCQVTGSIICRGATVKAQAVISEDVILGDKAFIGTGAFIHPSVKIWPDKHVEAGANVSMNLIWGIQWPGSLFGQDGISGLANIEITPEFALKLGAAYGASLEKGDTVTTSRDAHPASRMFNRAIICGLISVGCNVFDLRVCPTPVARYTIRNCGLKGGIHSRISPEDARAVLIEFFDPRGINTNRTAERKIENLFFREDFRRTSLDEVGVIEFPSRAVDEYNEGFFNCIDSDLVRKAKFKVVIDYMFGNASLVLPLLLGKLGCESVAINAYLDAVKGRLAHQERARGLQQLSTIVTTLEANMGVVLDLDAECLVLIDEKGHIISDQQLLALMSLLVMQTTRGAIVAAPISASNVLEKIAAQHHAKIIRTKADGRSLMHTAQVGEKKIHLAGRENGAFIFPPFQPSFDGMFAFAQVLEMMARQGITLSELTAQIPQVHLHRARVDCARQHKGRIMRALIEEHRGKPMDLIEGIKVYFDAGWVLAMPDPILPELHLVAEAESDDDARSLVEEFRAKIETLLAQEEPATMVPDRRRRARDGAGAVAPDTVLPDEKAFHFWAQGRNLGIRATSFREFIDTLLYVDLESLEYHLERGDFVNWLEYELQNEPLATRVRQLRERDLRGEELRSELLKVVR